MKILITGAAGFIGNELALFLLQHQTTDVIVGIDNLNHYYNVELKHARMNRLGIQAAACELNTPYVSSSFPQFTFYRMDIADKKAVDSLFEQEQFDMVINLAAQAGVRYSITHPYTYLESNVLGFLNILEACRWNPVKHLLYASSSSVYGLDKNVPYRETENVDQPVSLYAAFKKSDELMAHAYAKLYNIPCTGLRFFTVYGPWGRPDMSPVLFADAITKGQTLKVFNNGNMLRDFTFISDIVEGIVAVLHHIPDNKVNESGVPCRIFNIGCGHSVKLMDFIELIEQNFQKQANKEFLPMQPGDVYQTYADTTQLESACGFKPKVQIAEGVALFAQWYKQEYQPLCAAFPGDDQQ